MVALKCKICIKLTNLLLFSCSDQYTVTKIYECILETDENDMIVGGEWVENSKQDHFDFMWFPKAAPPMNSTALGGLLRYENVKELLDQSNSVDC